MEHNRVIYERLIYDSEIEYIQNNNSLEAIDSLFVIPTTATSLKIEAKFCFTNHTRYQALCGYQNDGFTTPSLYLFYSQNTTTKTFYIGSTTQRTDELNVDLPDNFIFDGSFTMQNGIATVYGNNGSINKSSTYNNNLWKGGSYSLIIMGGRVGASHIGEDTGIMKLYKFSLTIDNVVVRDFIPVRKGQTGYLYDKITKRLYGAISGNFILGPDVTNPVPNIRRVFRFDNKRFIMPMPYDSRVEYLKSDGYQYLDIGIIPKSGYRAICEYMPEKNSTDVMALFGSRANANSSNMFDVFMAFGTNRQFNAQYAGNKSALYVNNIPNTLHTIELGEKSYLDGNLLKTVTTTFNGAYTISIFAIHQQFQGSVNYNDRRMKDCRVYSFKLYNDSDTLIFDGIPVRRGIKGYMYDKVSGRLFGNKGTGNFILGNDIND